MKQKTPEYLFLPSIQNSCFIAQFGRLLLPYLELMVVRLIGTSMKTIFF